MPANTGLVCPVCQEPLNKNEAGLACSKGHHFDRSKQGHWNLLLNQHKKSKNPGDSADMVTARKQFFESGHYRPIKDELCQLSAKYALKTNAGPLNWLDIGCGEGYYTSELQAHLSELNPHSRCAAFDISAPAIKSAAKQFKNCEFYVANAASLPIADNTQALALSLFCRVIEKEAARVLEDSGIFITANTGEHHLIELRERLYGQLKEYKPTPVLNTHFTHLERTSVRSSFQCADLVEQSNLLKMTPHYWRCSEEAKATIENSLLPHHSIDVVIDVYQKT